MADVVTAIFVMAAAQVKQFGNVLLFPYQVEAIESLSNGSLLVAGVGSGKSITALAYFLLKECGAESNGIKLKKRLPLYIITTARKRDTYEWNEECAKLGLRPGVQNLTDISVVIDSWNNIKRYADVTDAFFIFDEHKAIGSGVWAKTFVKIARKNRWIVLTATPGDTWLDYIPVFLANGFYKNRTEFLREHVVFSRYTAYPKVERYLNVSKLIRLRESITTTMVGRKPVDFTHTNILSDYNREDYGFVEKNRWNIFDETPIQNASEYARVLRKIVNSDNSKCDRVLELLSKHKKALIFYNFNYELEMLRSMCESNHILYGELNGHRHDTLPDGDSWVYLIQYISGAEGWECTKTDTTIFFSPNYSYKTMVQSAGRINRLNTPYEKLYYYHLMTDSSIDRHIQRAIDRKELFNENMFFEERV